MLASGYPPEHGVDPTYFSPCHPLANVSFPSSGGRARGPSGAAIRTRGDTRDLRSSLAQLARPCSLPNQTFGTVAPLDPVTEPIIIHFTRTFHHRVHLARVPLPGLPLFPIRDERAHASSLTISLDRGHLHLSRLLPRLAGLSARSHAGILFPPSDASLRPCKPAHLLFSAAPARRLPAAAPWPGGNDAFRQRSSALPRGRTFLPRAIIAATSHCHQPAPHACFHLSRILPATSPR
jgi:hypothetical protein